MKARASKGTGRASLIFPVSLTPAPENQELELRGPVWTPDPWGRNQTERCETTPAWRGPTLARGGATMKRIIAILAPLAAIFLAAGASTKW
jgi:hypothetical protein